MTAALPTGIAGAGACDGDKGAGMSSRAYIDDPNERQMWTEGRGDRLELAREAGWGQVSWGSVLAGVLTAIGAFAVCFGAAAAILGATGTTTDTLTDSEWTRLGVAAGLAAALALLFSFTLGGYTAGRMARRAGLRHGVLVLVVGTALVAGAIGVAHLEGALSALRERFDDLGAPTGDSTWSGIALLTVGVAFAGSLAGAAIGGVRGERWHQRLVARALDPDVGPEADLRANVEAQRQAAAKALARARKAGVIPVDEETDEDTVTRDQPTATFTSAQSDGEDRKEDEREPTGAGRSKTPSSWSSSP